jgi:L-asparaginase II
MKLVSVYRGGRLESSHSGSIAVVDSSGRLLASAGDPALETFIRSAAKPFQALPLLGGGGADEFDLTSEEIALICASHGGEPQHVSTAAAILRKGELDESDLQCGAHYPFDVRAATELRQSGESPSVLHNNCSGKHAGMLLACRLFDDPTAGYLEPDHPLQRRIASLLGDFASVDGREIPVAVDGCGVPAYYLSLHRAAYAYARLFASSRSDLPELERYSEEASLVVESMTRAADFVAGEWSLTTPLMQAFSGQLLAKEGGEAFYAMALAPELARELDPSLNLAEGSAVGIALKIHDGWASRARDPVVLETLALLGVGIDSFSSLERFRSKELKNVAGRSVGAVKAEFELKVY